MRPEMTCAQCRELLPRYHTRQLPDAERDAVARHIAGCDECGRELAFWSAVGDALAASDAVQPTTAVNQERVWGNVRAALARERPVPAPHAEERGRRMITQTPSPAPHTDRRPNMPPAPSRRRPIAAAGAFALIVLLSVALFGVVAPRLRHTPQTGHGPQPTATPTACAASQLRQSLPANASLSAISMVSARDGWAVGQTWDPSHPATAPQALMVRFHNCQWQQAGLSASAAELTDVAMASPDDGWAVGVTVRAESISPTWVGEHALLLHYHDGVWQPVTIPGDPDAIGARIRVASPSDGWMLVDEGKSHPTPYTPAYSYALYHYDGTAWSAQPMPFKTPSMILSDIAAGPDDLWIVGYDTGGPGGGVIARFHDGQWTTWTNTIGGSSTDALYVVAVSSPQNVWAFGTHPYHDAHGDSIGDIVLHYDGASWSQVPIAGSAPGTLGPSTGTALANGNVWSFEQALPGGPGSSEIAIHCAATGCQASALSVPGVDGVGALAMFSATRGFAIGDHIVYGQGIGVPQSTMLFYDGGQWSVVPSAG